jgi:hypothetical protein
VFLDRITTSCGWLELLSGMRATVGPRERWRELVRFLFSFSV